MTLRILVTDGPNKNALSVIRSLGKSKENRLGVTTPVHEVMTLCSFSKYCHKTHFLKPESTPESKIGGYRAFHSGDVEGVDSYAEKLLDIVNEDGYDVLMPVGLESYMAASKHAKKFGESAGVAVPEWEKMQIAFNKEVTMKFAEEVGVPIPKTTNLLSENDLELIDVYPVVIKSSDSFLRYCNNKNELLGSFRFIKDHAKMGIICQEYVKGFGCGFYGVYDRGKLIAHFLHKRLTELPATGGASAMAESYFDERLRNYGEKLCGALKWHGPIMAEFKYDAENDDYRLIELNPKLWGSLDLTIAAGIDVPGILLAIALGKKPEVSAGYKYVKYKWLFPDHFWALVSDFSFVNLKEFIGSGGDVQTNFYPDDVAPFMVQMMRGFVECPAVFVNSRREYPHGKVRRR